MVVVSIQGLLLLEVSTGSRFVVVVFEAGSAPGEIGPSFFNSMVGRLTGIPTGLFTTIP